MKGLILAAVFLLASVIAAPAYSRHETKHL